ncbi:MULTISPECIES: TRAP transporter small permease [Aerococcus]|uniref:TRAP transporter small permease n=1 Tax=Aerococcus sanguinicola TaxID=119206 RepID=A0A5N1GH56_9LACT|nr:MULTISPECIES: TRAP transporter small permease [Aerococcus]KAA9299656.1 TRAP transporter small permease [Aerococcus sanguinicola]MDK6369953.1 TRAP transporter small permease [Aerococcus sp. UMB9870]MDK6680573.1 TRAP transporter small permease [Aerococcus sp. UMB8608]MDK6687403.1 TRAP transporter small permease [Aerococcus sp. UMB8623]MDK6940476.1 TRAP transporter small permease [Aerococcus sp. UMB8487]
MQQIRHTLDQIMRVFNALTLGLMTLLTVWQVFTRYLLHAPSTWSEELASYMFAWVTMFGAAYVFGKREHMNIPVILERFSAKTQKALNLFSEALIFVFAIVVLIYGGIEITSLTMGQMSSSLPLPMGYFYAVIPLSGIFIALYSVLNMYDIYQKPLAAFDSAKKEEDN